MTKAGKCDGCRQRKIKCDEKHPTCGPCSKVKKECKYTYGHVSRFVNYHQEDAGPSSSSSQSVASDSSGHKSTKSASSSTTTRRGGGGRSKDEEVMLSLRSSKSTQAGDNLMQTFNLVPVNKRPQTNTTTSSSSTRSSRRRSRSRSATRSTNNQREMEPWETPLWGQSDTDGGSSSLASPLLQDWLAFLGTGSSGGGQESALYCLGDWVDIVAQYIGHNQVVDAAVTAVICGACAFSTRTEENVTMARESNMNALRVLRLSLSEDKHDISGSRGALVATKLLDIAEVLINPESYHRQYHARGLVDILRRLYSQSPAYDETIQNIYYGQFFSENMRAIYRGEGSAFERASWYEMAPPDGMEHRWPGYSLALKSTMQDLIRTARLVAMTRQVLRHPRDTNLRAGAAHLALVLFQSEADDWISQHLDNNNNNNNMGAVQIVPTVHPDAQMLAHSYHFQSPRLFHLLVTYWTSRLLLSGCIQKLGGGPSLDLPTVQALDLQSANNIAMCIDYCLRLDNTLPCAQMMLLLSPLTAAFGAWHRLAGREGRGVGGGSGTAAAAAGPIGADDMMTWSLFVINGMETSLSLRLSTHEELVRRTNCLSGGSVYETGS